MNAGLSRGKILVVVIVIAALVSSAVLAVSLLGNPFEPSHDELDGVSVAVYFDRGTTAASREAVISMMEWMGATCTVIDEDAVRNGSLSSYDMLIMPGGCYCDERCQVLLQSDFEIIRDFVSNGGAFLGIDGGAIYATAWRLDLFHGDFIADENGTGEYLMEVNVNQSSTDPDMSAEPVTYSMLYEDSGYFTTDDWSGISVICTYQETDHPCAMSLRYGDGNVFLISPHPEYEEGSPRDNTDYYDTLGDPDSEWNFMLKICVWLLS